METLFMVKNSSLNSKDNDRKQVQSSPNQENRVLDLKKSQNIAILLRALNVTIDEVCEALLEGKVVTFIKMHIVILMLQRSLESESSL